MSANIVWCRIDERLLHGQVKITWMPASGANTCIVCNDDVAEGPTADFAQAAMRASAGGEFKTSFYSVDKLCAIIDKAKPEQKIFIVCSNPTDVARLIEGGVPIKQVNVGNMHFHEGKHQIAKTVSVDSKDIAAFERIAACGVVSTVQNTPDQDPVEVLELAKATA
ncbi:PTS sugar transporter subunit IIB [Vibrio alfacsensis]|uniref:PTS sugar transporter subunit IIB n=1 Tax=Vibrio alfacsensis TaxID=1074311 RepID=UPI00406776EF